jgi:hypothetical protein
MTWITVITQGGGKLQGGKVPECVIGLPP